MHLRCMIKVKHGHMSDIKSLTKLCVCAAVKTVRARSTLKQEQVHYQTQRMECVGCRMRRQAVSSKAARRPWGNAVKQSKAVGRVGCQSGTRS
jgi:hypothetical protein